MAVETAVHKKRLKVKSGEELYSMLRKKYKKYGTPLYTPQPNARLSKADRRKGIEPGSVGYFISKGTFDVLHNNVFRSTIPAMLDTNNSSIVTSLNAHDIHESPAVSREGFLSTSGISKLANSASNSDRQAIYLST